MNTYNMDKENISTVSHSLKEKEYWRNTLSGGIEKVSFPHDLGGGTDEMANHKFEIKEEVFNRILSLSKESIPMIYMILASNLKALIFKCLGENDIVIGSPVEKQKDNKNLINTILPLRSKISNDLCYKQLLLQVRKTIIEAIDNQNYPFETIKNDLKTGYGSNSFNPLFDIAIYIENLHEKSYLEGSESSMVFGFNKCDDKIEASIDYNSSLYKKETIEKIGKLYVQLMKQLLFNIDKQFNEVSLVSTEEYTSLILDWNDTASTYTIKKSILDVFEEQVQKNGNEIALSEDGNTFSYQELDEQVNRFANSLKKRKIEKGTVIGILLDRSIDFIVSTLAVLKAECIFLPIDIGSNENRINFILDDSGCELLITNKDLHESTLYDGNKIIFDSKDLESYENYAPTRTYNENETAYIIYTSGTTGKPKGTYVLHRGLTNYILWATETYVKGEKLSFPLFTSVAFDLTITSIFTPLASGGTLFIYNSNESGNLIEEIVKENKVNVIKLTPSHLKLIRNFNLDENSNEKSIIKRFIVGGEQLETAISNEIFDKFQGNIEIFNEYGPTEATVGSMIYKFDKKDTGIAVPIGKPIANTQIYLLNRFLEPVPQGFQGEMFIAGSGLAGGYHKKPELTAAKFIDNPFVAGEKMYKTGDLGRINEDNNLEFIGRKDQQVKIRGFRVELGEIENKIQTHLKENFSESPISPDDYLQLNIEEQKRCSKCLLPENYESITIGSDGVCSLCNEFESYKEKAFDYFKTLDDLETLIKKSRETSKSKYDCLLLFSGGKDSTYVLHRLVKMGLKILTFTYDNGYISKQAFENIEKITKKYNVDSLIIESDNMREVLCESLKTDHNVCNGCFKGVNTVGAKIANDYGINAVFTGLSRGQIFEIKLQGLFKLGIRDSDEIDEQLKIFRREYHSMNTKTSRLLNIEFEDSELDNIQFIDYFRYDDIKTRDVLNYLIKVDKSWDKPADTGTSSSNCMINDVGIYVHYKDKGYHFYADQSSWDCRLETISREEGIDELKGFTPNYDKIGEVLNELGYYESSTSAIVIDKTDKTGDKVLCAYFVADKKVEISSLQKSIAAQLPDYMVPSYFMQIDKIPLTLSGKVNKDLLPEPKMVIETQYVAPITPTQKKVTEIWSDVLDINIDEIGIHNNFFELGGHSLKATLLISEIEKRLLVKTPLIKIFENPTIGELANLVDQLEKKTYTALKKVEQKEYYSLSSAQKRLYFLQRLDLESTSYNIPLVVSWGEKVDIDLLNETFKTIIKRHESFRTSFVTTNDEPVQKVLDEVSFKMDYFEAKSKEETKLLIDEYIKPFDLSKAPLLRSCIIKSHNGQYIWVVDMHHIISDGTSSTILNEDFLSLYKGNELKPLKFQYKDFSGWQNSLIESGEIESQEKYWLKQFSDENPRLQLPTDFKRPEVFNFEGDKYKFSLDAEDHKKLMELGDKNSATLYMNMLAILNILFYKYTGQTDIIIGSGIAGRSHSDLQSIVGMFVNTLAMRNYPEGDKTYLEFLKEVISRSVMAFENQDIQFEDLVDKLKVERDTSRNPLFDINMLVQNFRKVGDEEADSNIIEVQELDDIGSKIGYRNITSKFDMTFFVQEQKEGVNIVLEYYTGIFKKETIERLVFHFKNLIKSVIKNPDTKLKELNIITEEEEKQFLFDFNNTKADYSKDKTIPEIFKEQVLSTPDKIAIVASSEKSGISSASVGKDIHITFTELDKRSNQLANYLINENDVQLENKIGVIMDNSPDLITSILGILKSGAAYVPLDPTQPEKRIETIINNSGIEIVISGKKYIRLLNRLQWECESLSNYLCLDSMNVHLETEDEGNELMDIKLWDYIGETSTDEITGGGWNTSYTGEPFSKKEMDEYSDNILQKVKPILNKEIRVLEIGCSSGLSMYKIAPQVGFYYGTDLSEVIIKNNKEKIKKEGIKNIKLASIPAHEIDKLDEKGFDLIIMNSVIQSFHGHNYLREVVNKSVDLLNDQGRLFIGDVMDQDTKGALIKDLVEFQKFNADKDYTTKTSWSSELFVSRLFFEDLSTENPAIQDVKFSKKICTIENELTKFRFDTLIVVDKKNKSTNQTKSKNKYQADQRMVEEYSTEIPEIKLKPNNLAYIIYTSGTTGTPKGVMIEHQSLNNYVSWGKQQYINGNDISFPLYTNFSFDLTATSVYLPLLSGNKIVIYQNSNAQFLVETIVKDDIVDIIKVTPSHLKVLQNSVLDLQSNNRLNKFIVGGEALERQLSFDIEERFNRKLDIYNEYGPTEATVGCMIYKYDRSMDDRIFVPIGKPINNIEIYILDKYLNPLPQGASGELYVAGDSLSRGYIKNRELSEELFIDNPFTEGVRLYKTGDLARFLPDGNIEFLGRVDDQLKIRGYRIELSEIESALLKLENIKESIVIAREENEDKQVCAYVVCEGVFSEENIRTNLNELLPDYMIPAYFVELDSLPLTSNGKINKNALASPKIKAGEGYIAPSNEIEEKLTEIWSEVLHIPKNEISVDANFFNIGGHSLKATLLTGKIHKELGVEFPLRDVFKHSNIKAQASQIEISIKKDFISIPKANHQDYYPLSSAQKRLYLLKQMDLSSTVYNMSSVISLGSEPDKLKIEEVFQKLILRHESFRTSFELQGEELVQRIHERVDFKIEEYSIDKTEVQGIRNQFIQVFDLSQAPLLRAAILEIKGESSLLLTDMHHIISDGTSQAVLEKEFLALYSGEELSPLKLQYKDYSQWQNSKEQQEFIKDQEQYWLNKFEGEIPVLNLPTDYTRPVIQSHEGSRVSFALSKEETNNIRLLSEENGLTLYMSLLSVFTVLLSKLSGQEDIIVGTPIEGRRHIDLENIVGMFVNTLAIRNEVKESDTLKGFIEKLKQNTLDTFENQDYQFEDLVEQVSVEQDISRNPLFDVMYNLLNHREYEGDLTEFSNKGFIHTSATSKFDLILTGIDYGDQLLFSFTYCTKLFKAETIDRYISYFKRIVNQIPKYLERTISEIELIGAEEKQQLLYDFNNTQRDYPRDKTIHQLFEEQAERTPEKIASVFATESISYIELNKKANQLARYLRGKGLLTGDRIGLIVERSLDMIIGIFGILKAGGVYVPIDSTYPEYRIKYILDNSDSKLILSQSTLIIKSDYELPVLLLDELELHKKDEANLKTEIKSTDISYIIYTSGSTGNPKGVQVEHSSVVNLLYFLQESYPINEHDSYLLKTSYCFDVSISELFGWILGGGKLIILEQSHEKDPIKIIDAIYYSQITHINFVPSVFKAFSQSILPAKKDKLKSLKYIMIAGEALIKGHLQEFKALDLDIQIENLFGPTEATVYTSHYTILPDETSAISIGKPISNYSVYIVDSSNKLQPLGIGGELCIGGIGLSRGYVNNESLTSEKFIAHPFKQGEILYRTGDLARWLPDGNIEFLGRIDHQVKIRGFRIELGEIENVLLRHENIRESVVLAMEEKGDKYLCAYVVCTEGYTQADLRQYLSTLLPDYMIPSYFVELDKIPLTINGKLNRKALPSPEVKAGDDYVAPSNAVEEKLVGIWSEVLNIPIEEISVTADFFTLGGQSLKATLLVNKIFKLLNIEVPLAKVFEYKNIRGLVKVINKFVVSEYYNIEKAPEKDYYKLSASQNRLYVLYEFNKESTAYNMPQIVNLGTELDRKKLKHVLEHLIMRHEALRTSFKIIDNEVMQKITKLVSLDIEYFESTQEGLNNLFQSFIRPFDLSKTPLFRVGLVKTENLENLMMIDMHHIIFDGISQNLMIKDFMSLYNNEKLDELKLQYKDYSEWQHSSKGKDEIKKQSDYWIKEFENGVPSLNIITDYERPQIQSFEGANLSFFINQEQSKQIKEFCQKKGVTEFTYFISIYTLLWNKILNKEKELFFGVGLSGRIHPDLQDVIGFFVNTLPFSIDISSELTFVKLIENVKNKSFHLMDNQGCQFEDLIMKGELEKRNTKLPLYEAAFVWQNLDDLIIKEDESNLIDANSVMLDNQGDTSKFDMLFSGQRYKDGFKINLNYSTKLFKESTILGLKEIFCKIIENVTGDVNIPISSIDVFSKDVSSKLLEMEDENIIEDIDFTF